MDKETAERAKSILEELDILNDILDATDKEESHWWGFLSPDVKRWHSEGIRLVLSHLCRGGKKDD